jgi:hypothetical protein
MDLFWGHTMIVLGWPHLVIASCLVLAVFAALVVLVVVLLQKTRPRQ